MPARKPTPIYFGSVTEVNCLGSITVPLALTIQRYLSRNGLEMWRIVCPRCGRIHEHGAGEGGRSLHCGAEIKDRSGYYLTGGGHLPLIPNVREADAELRSRGWL